MRGRIAEIDEKNYVAVVSTDYGFNIMARLEEDEEWRMGTPVLASVRPEAITVHRRKAVTEELNNVDGKVRLTTYLGDIARYEIETQWGGTMQADVYNPRHRYIFREGEKISVGFAREDVKLIKLE